MMGIQIIFRQFGDLHEPGQQEPAATGRARHQAGTARSAARPESGAADAAAQRKARSGDGQKLILRDPRARWVLAFKRL
jgi:hypothetical protein